MHASKPRALVTLAMMASTGCMTPVHRPSSHDESNDRRASGSDSVARTTEHPLAHRLRLVAQAERALEERWPLDYRRPFASEPYDGTRAKALYLQACVAGDKPSCWLAATLDDWRSGEASAHALANCRAGDIMSCRALPRDGDFGSAPGWAGRSEGCRNPLSGGPCDQAVLRSECSAGFALSCQAVGIQQDIPDTQEREAMWARALPLAREGCRAKIDHECGAIGEGTSPADVQLSAESMCPLLLHRCGSASFSYRTRGEVEHARDLAEQLCQYSDNRGVCLLLGEDYTKGVLPEPIRGRGAALIGWACESPSLQQIAPTCGATARK